MSSWLAALSDALARCLPFGSSSSSRDGPPPAAAMDTATATPTDVLDRMKLEVANLTEIRRGPARMPAA
eukprot:SM000011S19083  [mRNA]  locus=s11:753953:754159:- [translate_table: standard]